MMACMKTMQSKYQLTKNGQPAQKVQLREQGATTKAKRKEQDEEALTRSRVDGST